MSNKAVLIAITDPTLHPEASHVAAASGREVIATTDPRDIARHAHKAAVVLVDATTAHHVASLRASPVVLLENDPGPCDFQLAMEIHAEAAMLLPAQAPELLELIGREDEPPPGHHAVLAVCGAAGGAGTTTFAAALAMQLHRAVFVDADPYSGGCDLLFGAEQQPGLRWNDLGADAGELPGQELTQALVATHAGVPLLTHARGGETRMHSNQVLQVIRSLRACADVVVDCRLGTEITEAVLGMADSAIVLIPAEVRAAAAAAEVQRHLATNRVRHLGVLRHRQWSGIDASEAATISGMAVPAEIPTVHRLSKRAELEGISQAPRPLQRAAQAVLEALESLPAKAA